MPINTNSATKDRTVPRGLWAGYSRDDLVKTLLSKLTRSVEQSVQYSTPKFVAIGALGVVGFPLYYWIWAYLFPQPYENLPLRLFGSVVFLLLTLASYWPANLRRYLPVYWYGALLFGLPFFFNFMLFKNNGSQVWLMSTLVALFLMTLVLDWLNLIIMYCVGSALAWFANWATGGNAAIPFSFATHLPIFIFATLAGAIFSLTREIVAQEKLETMLAAASNIAHELRTPLLGIKSGVTGLQRYMPVLFQAYQLAKENNLKVETIRAVHFDSMMAVLSRIQAEVESSNTTIDILLMNATLTKSSQVTLVWCSMAKCVDSALDRYPFSSNEERKRIAWDGSNDFEFLGSDTLMIHVYFNFLKNALHAIARAQKGQIEIWLVPGARFNEVHFKDTGSGISALVLPQIFTRFYSWSDSSEGEVGTGVGLAFCRSVVDSFGGNVNCRSILGEFTEFVIMLPNKAIP